MTTEMHSLAHTARVTGDYKPAPSDKAWCPNDCKGEDFIVEALKSVSECIIIACCDADFEFADCTQSVCLILVSVSMYRRAFYLESLLRYFAVQTYSQVLPGSNLRDRKVRQYPILIEQDLVLGYERCVACSHFSNVN